jgi:hypothetical protein
MRWTRLIPSAALVLAALSVAACTATPVDPVAQTGQDNGTPPVTATQARQAFDNYITVLAKANDTGDGALALSAVTGVQRAAVAYGIKSEDFFSRHPVQAADLGRRIALPRFDPYGYGTPTFYLPEQAGYPHWFVVAATRTVARPRSPA